MTASYTSDATDEAVHQNISAFIHSTASRYLPQLNSTSCVRPCLPHPLAQSPLATASKSS